MTHVYGLGNCDSCRKARKWLDGQGISYTFVDVRESTPGAERLQRWLDAVGADTLVNRRSTTWRGLDDATRQRVMAAPADLLGDHPTLIKRPILDTGTTVMVGFNVERWQSLTS